jgi:hypothetical protein
MSRSDFDLLMQHVPTVMSLGTIQATVDDLHHSIQDANSQLISAFTPQERIMLQSRITADQRSVQLLLEREAIQSNAIYAEYYSAIQAHFSGLMVASLGVASGYISVKNSQSTIAVDWVCTAVSSAFPGASLVTTGVNAGVKILDAANRKLFLAQIGVLGTTITEAEVLGEEVARLLVRAHFNAKHKLHAKQAERDAQAMITAIVSAAPPFSRNADTATHLVKAIWGEKCPCLDPIAVTSPVDKKINTSITVGVSSSSNLSLPFAPLMTQRAPEANTNEALTNEALMRLLLEEREQRKLLEDKLNHVTEQLQQTPLRSEVAFKKDLAKTDAKVAQMEGSNASGGGLTFMKRSDGMSSERTEERFIALERELAHTQAHLLEVTQQTMLHQELLVTASSPVHDSKSSQLNGKDDTNKKIV